MKPEDNKPTIDNLSVDEKISLFLKKFANKNASQNTYNEHEFGGGHRSGGGDFYDSNELDRLNIREYSGVRMEPETYERLERLNKIAKSIEKKVVTKPEQLALFPKRDYKINYAAELNEAQYLAITTVQGPLLVIAGAGSGKTRTIVYRVSYLLENGILPEQILLLTFTRKAAQEMVTRTKQLLKTYDVDRIMRGTYHAFASYLLRRHANMIGIAANFTIIDPIDSEDIVDLIRNEFKLGSKDKAFPRKSRIFEIISKSRNCSQPIRTTIMNEFSGAMDFMNDIELIAKTYQQYKQTNQILDYDDLMETLRDKLRDHEQFRRLVQQSYQYVMVDEFQDTNLVQKDIVDLVAGGSKNIMVVGDDSQSIYAFRGANFENILTFPETYPNCKVVKLEHNYRSNQPILAFVNDIIRNAKIAYPKQLYSNNPKHHKPLIAKFNDQQEEAAFIVSRIIALREKNIPLNQIAVLYRSSYHSNFIQTELLKRGIPYVMVGGIKFIERSHIKDLIAYLRISVNPLDAIAWNRILKLVPGIGQTTASKIIDYVHNNHSSIQFGSYENKKFGKDLESLGDMLNNLRRNDLNLPTKIDVLRDYYRPILKSREPDWELRLQDIEVIHQLAYKYQEVQDFLTDFALDPPSNKYQDAVKPLIDESEDQPVTLSTIHSAKGLEWYCVFLPHLLDGLFPSSRSLKSLDQLEEERRLFYVACSRAEEELYLTMPAYYSAWDNYFTQPSRFIAEIQKDKYTIWRPGQELE